MRLRLRVGDVVRFRRGNSEYVGTVRSARSGWDYAVLDVFERKRPPRRRNPARAWSVVMLRDIVAVEEPRLTAKEREGLLALDDATGGRRPLPAGRVGVSARTLSGLEGRGLAEGLGSSVSGSRALVWRTTPAGRRVAAQLRQGQA